MSNADSDIVASSSFVPYARPALESFEPLVPEAAGLVPSAQRLRQAEKAEALGHLAGGLVHDFNNLLGVIVCNLDRVGRLLPADTVASRCVADAVTATDRAVALARRLLAFVRQQPLLPEVIEVDRLLSDLKPLIEVAAPGCTVVLDLACAWHSLVDANQLENVVLNLAVNARDAMPGGGRLTIATRTLHERGSDTGARSDARDYVVLEVRDNGRGMSPEIQAKASEPFFTTKAAGLGTGLGLSQVYGFAAQCGGTVRLMSEAGKGTSVTLHIPRVLPGAGFAALPSA